MVYHYFSFIKFNLQQKIPYPSNYAWIRFFVVLQSMYISLFQKAIYNANELVVVRS